MAWTTFAALGAGPATPNELDSDLQILTYLANVTCSIVGTNSLTLTPANAGAPLTAYQQNMQFTGIVVATNTGPMTVTVVGFPGVLNVYKDTLAGPVLLIGGEAIVNCAITLRYDQALNGGAGGFHIQGGGGASIGTTLSIASLLASTASISGVGSFATLNASGGSVTLSNLISGAASVSGLFNAVSISFSGADALVRLNSTLASISQVTLTPFAFTSATVTLSGAAVNDMVFVNEVGTLAFGSLHFKGYVPATGSVIVTAQNALNASTLTLTTVSFRVTDYGFVT